MSVQSTLNLRWLGCDRRKAVTSLSAVSILAAILTLKPSPLRSAPLPVLHPVLPVLTPQMGGTSVPTLVTPLNSAPIVSSPAPLLSLPPIPERLPTVKSPSAGVSTVSNPLPPSPLPVLPPTTSPSTGSTTSTNSVPSTIPPVPLPQATPVVDTPIPPLQLEGTAPVVNSPYATDTYHLSVGDSISIFVANIPEFTTKNVVMGDGTINLPIAGPISVWGMTLAEAAQAITKRYVQMDILRNPFISVQLLSSSPLKIAVSGAIKRPGAYNIPVIDTKLPTLTDAIALAGGIAGTADLKQVKVYRLSPSGTDQVLNVNLWDLIHSADLRQDITLRSGDRILLAKAPIKPEEASLISSANLSPTDMQVGILGEVLAPGLIKMPPNTSLNQALMLAGGFNKRAQQKTVELIRSNDDGSVTRRKYKVDWSDPIGENTNPILQQRDVILVGSSTLTRYGDILGKILSPLTQSFSFLGFFNFLFPNGNL